MRHQAISQRNREGAEQEDSVNDGLPHQHLQVVIGGVAEGLEQVDRGDADDRRSRFDPGKAVCVCLIGGVGFNMRLVIGGLAFQGQGAVFETQLKIGVLGGSLLAGSVGSLMLVRSGKDAAVR